MIRAVCSSSFSLLFAVRIQKQAKSLNSVRLDDITPFLSLDLRVPLAPLPAAAAETSHDVMPKKVTKREAIFAAFSRYGVSTKMGTVRDQTWMIGFHGLRLCK